MNTFYLTNIELLPTLVGPQASFMYEASKIDNVPFIFVENKVNTLICVIKIKHFQLIREYTQVVSFLCYSFQIDLSFKPQHQSTFIELFKILLRNF